jgi:hypothetical protein
MLVDTMKRFTLADGDIFFECPSFVGPVRRDWLDDDVSYKFMFTVAGKDFIYRSRWKVEVERERERLLAFNWED